MNALEEALARRERAGLAEYGERAHAMAAPARSRVRRVRTMRATGWGAAAVVVVVLALTGILTSPFDRTVDPAGSRDDLPADAVRAEDLLVGASLRIPGLQADDVRQAALRCEVGLADNPWARSDTEGAIHGAECDAVRVGDQELLRLDPERTTVRVDRTDARATFTIEWTVQNVSTDTTLAVDRGAAVAGLVVGESIGATPPAISNTGFWTTSAWMTPSTRLGLLVSDTDSVALAPGATLSGSTTLAWDAADTSFADEALTAIAFGGAYPDVTVQLRVLPAEAPGGTELLLEATALITPEITVAEGTDGVVADDLRSALRPRNHETADALDLQPVLHCEPEPGLDPRWGEIDQDGLNVVCGSFWTSDAPLLDLTQLSFTVDGDELSVGYEVRNVAGFPLAVDIGAAAVAVSASPATTPGQGMSVNLDRGALWGDQLWVSDTERFGAVRVPTGSLILPDDASFAGEARFPLDRVPSDGSGEWSIQVPVGVEEGTADALLLEVFWDGEPLSGPAEG